MRIEPLFDKVLVKPADSSEELHGRIVVPDMGKEKPEKGTVIAIGPGRLENGVFVHTEIQVGDEVLLPKFGTQVINFDGEEYYLCRESDLIAKLYNTEKQ
jgi:chaperonin GroES